MFAPPPVSGEEVMLTTTVDGLWVLQVLAGVEVVAPELGLRPHLPSAETKQTALAHPVAAELRSTGVITDNGVDEAVAEWLTVLARRDVGLLLFAETVERNGQPERVLLARFAQWWVVLERCDAMVRLSAVGAASSERSAGLMINDQIERLWGERPPVALRPVVFDSGELIARVRDREGLRRFLIEQRLDGDQVAALLLASDPDRCARASLVALQSGGDAGGGRCHIAPGAVTVIDTPTGRLLAEQINHDGVKWMVVGPGSTSAVGAAAIRLMRQLPAQCDWYSYRKAV